MVAKKNITKNNLVWFFFSLCPLFLSAFESVRNALRPADFANCSLVFTESPLQSIVKQTLTLFCVLNSFRSTFSKLEKSKVSGNNSLRFCSDAQYLVF